MNKLKQWKKARIFDRDTRTYHIRKLYHTKGGKTYILHRGQERELYSDARGNSWYAYGRINIISFMR